MGGDFIKRQSLVTQVEAQLRELIFSGVCKEGEKLPSEISLCTKFNVSRPTIREAFRSLQAQGLVEIRPGAGTFLLNLDQSKSNAMNWFAAHSYEVRDYLEIRLAMETLATRLAIERGTEDEILALFGVQSLFHIAMEKNDCAEMAKLDENFHSRIARATHNPLLIQILDSVAQELEPFRYQTFVVNGAHSASKEHQDILIAMQSRDQNLAERKMQDHILHNISIVESYLQKKDIT